MRIKNPKMTEELATELFDTLVAHAGATERWRDDFVFHQVNDDEVCIEYRFQGALGFGGKFWRYPSSNGQGWYVNAYHEDESRPGVREAIDATNIALKAIEDREGGAF